MAIEILPSDEDLFRAYAGKLCNVAEYYFDFEVRSLQWLLPQHLVPRNKEISTAYVDALKEMKAETTQMTIQELQSLLISGHGCESVCQEDELPSSGDVRQFASSIMEVYQKAVSGYAAAIFKDDVRRFYDKERLPAVAVDRMFNLSLLAAEAASVMLGIRKERLRSAPAHILPASNPLKNLG